MMWSAGQAPEALKQHMAIYAELLPTYQSMREQVRNCLASRQTWGPTKGSGKRNQAGDIEVGAVQTKGWGKKGSCEKGENTDSTKGGKNGNDGKLGGKNSWHVGRNSWPARGNGWNSLDKNRKSPRRTSPTSSVGSAESPDITLRRFPRKGA